MILRKPYALLIKYFKLIHLIMVALISYLLYKAMIILSFFNTYINNNIIVTGQSLRENFFSVALYIIPIILVTLMFLLALTMYRKKKPCLFYIFSLIVYLLTFLLFLFINNLLFDMELSIVSLKTIKMYNDFFTISIGMQFIVLIVSVVRALGFDIRKFEFLSDLKELNISEQDREAFEVSFSFDLDKRKRGFRKKLRLLKYFYLENKLYVWCGLMFLFAILLLVIYNTTGIYFKVNKQGTMLSTPDYNLGITNSYLIDKDIEGRSLDENLLVIELNINTKVEGLKLNLNKFVLKIDNIEYIPTDDYKNVVSDLGVLYENQKLSKDYQKYLLVYEIPDYALMKKMVFIYKTTNDLKIKVSYNKLDEIVSNNYELGNEINFDNSGFVKGNIKLTSFEMKDKFEFSYRYCLKNKECIDAVEYIVPEINSNYDKGLIKLDIESEDIKVNSFISTYGVIVYEINGETKYFYDLIQVKPAVKEFDNTYFFEIDEEVLNSNSVSLMFKIRNYEYVYKLK